MGFGSEIGGFFTKTIPGFFSSAGKTISGVVSTLHGDVKEVFHEVISIPKSVIQTGGTIVTNGQDMLGSVGGKAIDGVTQIGNKAVDGATQLGKGALDFLGSPSFLLLAAGGLFVFMNGIPRR